MVNYGNGKIYKIESSLGDKIYIGSTTKAQLSQRMTHHRSDYKMWKDGKYNMTTSFHLFEEYGLENCKIVLLEDCPCETKDQLSAREAHYIRTLPCVNKFIPLRTQKERYETNREKIIEYQKEYRVDNKEKIIEKKKEWYEKNKDKIIEKKKEYNEKNKEKIKAYREDNKEAISAKRKEYREKNKEKIKAYREAKKATIV
jgi:hypothetical protein